MARRGFWKAMFGYSIITLALGMVWHFVWFRDLYHQLGIYNREQPIIPLGILSMLIQGVILAYLFPFFYYKGGHPVTPGIKYGLLMGVYMYSVSTLANAAKNHGGIHARLAWYPGAVSHQPVCPRRGGHWAGIRES